MKPKLIRITTVPVSMNIILKGQLAYMNQHFEVIGVSGYDEKHFNEIAAREGIRMHAIHMSRSISLMADLRALWRLYWFIRREKPAIVHTHTPKAGLLGMMAAWLARVPIRMHTVGGMPLMEVRGLKRVLLNKIETLTYTCAHRVYPNSKGLCDFIIDQQFCRPAKLKVLANGGSNGINTDYFKPDYVADAQASRHSKRTELGIQAEDLVFCFVGRIAREKGIVELLEVVERLQHKYPIKVILVGTFEKLYGALDASIEARIKANPAMLFLGRFDDVRPYYSMSDVFVFPSYREGFPNAVLEAGAMQLPIIATDINGCNEIIQHRHNGLLIVPKDEISLEHAMVALIQSKPLRENLAAHARKDIVSKFRREFVWEALKNEYDHLLKHVDA